MSYTIRTKDGIVIEDVDDSVDPNSDEMKAVVTRRRAQRDAAAVPVPEPSFGERFKSSVKDVMAIPGELREGAQRSLLATGRGFRQLAASQGLGDPEAARQAQLKVEQEEAGNPPSFTSDVGKTVTDIAPWMAGGMFAVPRAISMIPQALKSTSMIPRAIGSLVGGGVSGAAQNAIEPTSEKYDLEDKLMSGGLFGMATSPAGYVAGKLYAPFRNKGAKAAQENARILNEGGLPHQIPATQEGGTSAAHLMSNTLEKLPVFGDVLKRKRAENAAWLTQKATEGTGKAYADLTPSAREEMFHRLNAEGNAFRTQRRVNMTDVAATADIAQQNVHQYALDTAQLAREKPLHAAVTNLAPMPGNPAAAQRAATGMPVPNYPPLPKFRTADEVMDLRNAASTLAFKTEDPVLKTSYLTYKKSLEDKLRAIHGTDRFNEWLRNWGDMEDVARAAGGKSGAHLVDGHLTPERLAMNLDESFRPSTDPRIYAKERLIGAARGNMPTPPPGEPRSLFTSLMLGGGSILGGGGISKLAGGDFSTGATATGTLGAALAAGLSRKKPTQAQINMIRRMVMAGLISNNPF